MDQEGAAPNHQNIAELEIGNKVGNDEVSINNIIVVKTI